MLSDPKTEMLVVINTVYGGFWLSQKACDLLALRKHWVYEPETGLFDDRIGKKIYYGDIPRNDTDLVNVVLQMGAEASGPNSKLVVRRISVIVEIEQHDGIERIERAYIRNLTDGEEA